MNTNPTDDEIALRLLEIISGAKQMMTQRELSRHLGISLGKINSCINRMASQGFVQIQRFKNARNKAAHAYALTPKGMEEKHRLLIHFLSDKLRQYDNLKKEISELNEELRKSNGLRLEDL